MIDRREYLKLSLGAGIALGLAPQTLFANPMTTPLIKRAIPSTGELLPAVGLGSSASFSRLAGDGETQALREVLKAMREHGGSVFDTAPSYGASEAVAGQLAGELGITNELFWATKLNVAGRGGSADEAAARAQVEASFKHIGKQPIDLIQVHNLGDVPVQLAILKELKADRRIRYIGVTTTRANQYPQLEQLLKDEPLDFIGIDYAIDNRTMEERIFPLAREQGVGVLVYAPFGRSRLWERVRGQALPDWAAEFGAASWAQYFLKFVISHPAVTVATPATSKASHMIDNLGAAKGELPDQAMRQKMIDHIQTL